MAHEPAIKHEARRLFVFDRLTLEEVSKRLGIPLPTVRNWKKSAQKDGDDWEKVRAAAVMAGGDMEDISRAILTGFLVQYQSVMEALQTTEDISPMDKAQMLSSLSDSFNKTVAASRRVLPETHQLAVAMRVVGLLSDYIKSHHAYLLSDFVGILEGFGQILAKEFKS